MVNRKSRRGMALPFTIVAMIVVVGFVMTMTRMNQGVKSQIFHTNNHQLSFLLAFSAFSRVCAKVHSFSWENRPFATEPYVENKVALQGGYYDLIVENTKDKYFQADVYVRTNLAGISRMYFWRVRFNDDLLDVANQLFVESFLNGEPTDFPVPGQDNPFARKVADLLLKREANQKKSDMLANEISKLKKPAEIIKQLNGRPVKPFDEPYPLNPEDIEIAKKEPVDFPELAPQKTGELPGEKGPEPGAPVTAADSMLGEDMAKRSKDIIDSSKKVFDKADQAWKKVEDQGVEGVEEGLRLLAESEAAKAEAYASMKSFITQARTGISDAPSAEARIAIEEMVSQTFVAGVQNVVNSIDRGFDQFDKGGDSYLMGLSTAGEVEGLLTDWQAALDRTAADLAAINSLSEEISDFSKPAEVAQALAATLENAQKQYEIIEKYTNLAKQRLQELRIKEAEEAAAAAEAAGDGDD